MAKKEYVGICLLVAGIALAVQGCWEDDQNRLTLLGEGACRTADGGEGEPKFISAVSLDACKAACFNGAAPCAAVEYNANNSNCEVHFEPITKFEEVEGVSCYVVR